MEKVRSIVKTSLYLAKQLGEKLDSIAPLFALVLVVVLLAVAIICLLTIETKQELASKMKLKNWILLKSSNGF